MEDNYIEKTEQGQMAFNQAMSKNIPQKIDDLRKRIQALTSDLENFSEDVENLHNHIIHLKESISNLEQQSKWKESLIKY